ncbi:RHS repeat-associated core domain-containing protein [Nonomuraea sp. NPDC048892]|uniref:RHS repeat-associated core domain-containing protein n=1 Tax=Nonomuraea sp. NPDC048892 TaxID=3154624 RepID=UPI0033C920FA
MALLPGLVQAVALPAVAGSQSVAAVTGQGTWQTPPQQMGVGREGLPSVVSADVTMASPAVQGKRDVGKAKPPAGLNEPDWAPRSQSTLAVQSARADGRRLPPGAVRVEAQDAAVAAAPRVTDMWPLSGARTVPATPTLRAHAEGGRAPYRYDFTVCQAPTDDPRVVSEAEFDLWCLRQDPDGTWHGPVASSGQLAPGVHAWTVPAGELKWGATFAWKVAVTDASGASVTSAYHTFVTGVRQPAIGSQLATRDQAGQEFQAVSGNYTSTVVDASVPSAGPALSVVRTYNSMDARRDGLFGAGWSTRFDMRIVAESSASLLVTYPDGRRLRFGAKGDGTFQPPPGMHATLGVVPAGGWKLMDKSSTVYHFDAQGRLARVVDARGRAQELRYGSDGKLATVTGVGGRSLTFTWSGGHVSGVATDAVDGAPLRWTYTYDGDKLATACRPGAAPNCTTYTYSSGSQYRGLVEDDEPVGYWRLGDPYTAPAPTPTPTDPNCEINPIFCVPDGDDLLLRDFGWGAGGADYGGLSFEQQGALAGSTDTAVGLSGQSFIQLPDSVIPRLDDQLSLELWFKTTSSGVLAYTAVEAPPPPGTLFPPDGAPVLYVGTDGKLRGQWRARDSAGDMILSPITSSAAVNNGQWHHAVLAGSGNTQTLYLDGTAVGSLNGKIDHNWMAYTTIGHGLTQTGWPASKPLDPGDLTFTKWGFTGQIDEVALYDRPLGVADVGEHFAARLAAPHLLSTITLPSGRIWADNTYDGRRDRLLTHTDEHGGLYKIGEPSEIDRETGSSIVTLTDPANKDVKLEHDAWRGYRITAYTDQLGHKTTYGYDADGYPSWVKNANNIFALTGYDERGNLRYSGQCRGETDDKEPPLSCGGFFPVPGAQAINERYWTYHVNEDDEFDPRNDRVTAFRDGRSSSASDNTYATTYEYNAFGEQTQQKTPATPDFPNGRSASTAYTDGSEPAAGGGDTPAGLVKTRSDAKGNSTTFRYTAAGDLAEQTDPAGLVTTYEHDALGRVTSQTQISDAHPGGVKTSYTYDTAGRLSTQTAPGVKNEITNVTHTARTTYTYDADGRKLTGTVTDLTGGDAARTITYTYDAHGREESVTDAEGGVVRTAWNSLGLESSVTNEVGSVLAFTYTERGEAATVVLKNWTGSPVNPKPAKDLVLESYTYDPAGRLAVKVDVMGRRTAYSYHDSDLLYRATADDAKLNGGSTAVDVVLEENSYDEAGNLTKKVTGGGFTSTDFVYDAAGRLSSSTLDPAGLKRKTAYTYDANNLTTKVLRTAVGGSREESTSYTYNAAGIKTRETIENGDQDLITSWTVDDRGLPVAVIDPRGNADGASAADYTTTSTYDALGRLIETKAPSVQVDKAGTDTAAVRPTTRAGYDTFGNQTHTVDAEGRTVTTAFDKAGRAVKLTMPTYTPPGGTALTPSISHAYDAAGRRVSTTDPRGYTITTDYDALGNPVRQTDPGPSGPGGVWIAEYNEAGEQRASVDPNGARIEATYDDLGRKITETAIERVPATAAHTTKMSYNSAGMLTTTVDPRGKTTTYTPNAAGEVTATTDPANNTTRGTYDLAGRPLRVIDATLAATETSYDLAGRPTEVKDLKLASVNDAGTVLRSVKVGYDLAGNPVSQTSAEQHTVQQSFDALNRLTTLTEPVSAGQEIVTRFGYDAAGARTKLTDGRGNTTWTTYNSLDLVEKVIEPATSQHPDEADRTWTYSYDQAGNNTGIRQPGGVTITRAYDHLGRLTQEDGSGGGAATAQRTFGYDPAGRLTTAGEATLEYNDRGLLAKLTQPAQPPTTMTYDAAGNLTQRVDATGTATFTWDDASRLATAGDPVTGRTYTYGYDKANRVTSLTSANPANIQTFGYDDLGRNTSQTLKSSTGTELAKITYGWDLDDNLTTKTTTGLAGAGTNTYSYDHANRLTSWTAPGGTTTAYEWDAAGNRTKAGNKTFTYDQRNRLTTGDGTDYTYTPRGTLASQTKNGTTTQLTFDAFDRLIADGDSLYAYDAFDRVTSRITGTTRQTHLYAGLSNNLAAISVSGSIQAKYSRDPFGALLGIQEGSAPAVAAMSDLHGDLVATHTGTALASSTAYDPFGETTAQTGSGSNLGYQGEYTDPDTGKVNMHARWYQPGTATFTSRDSMTLEPSPSVQANRYTYANASPLTGIDPTGHSAVPASASARPGELEDLYNRNGTTGNTLGHDWSGGVYGPCVTCTDNVEFGFLLVMTKEDMKRRGHLPNGMYLPKGFFEAGENKINYLINAIYEDGLSVEQSEAIWSWLKDPHVQVNSKGELLADKSVGESKCPGGTSKKQCEALRNAAKAVIKAQAFYNTCFADMLSDSTKYWCKEWQYELGIKADEFEALKVQYRNDLAAEGKWFWTLLKGVSDFFWGDVQACSAQGGISCVLMIVNLLPGGAAAKGIGKLAKFFPKVVSALRGAAKACNSFAAQTLVLMANGNRKPIEEIQIGDYVLAADPVNGKTVAKEVTNTISGAGVKHLVQITLHGEPEAGASEASIVATSGHPFWVPSLRNWVDATYLEPGSWLRTAAGTWIQVAHVKRWAATQKVYNLSIADIHTYHVGVGDVNVLVHNDDPGMIGANGTKVTSRTTWLHGPYRIDVENPNPGQRAGQIHFQDKATEAKYLYNFETGEFDGMPSSLKKKLEKKFPEFRRGIAKGLATLGEIC